MSTLSIPNHHSQAREPHADASKDPLAGMTLLTAEGQHPARKAAIEITKNALKRIRVAMAKEGISPDAGGLRVGIQGGGCSGLSYNIRFDTQPRERDRIFTFGAGLETPNDPSRRQARPHLRRPQDPSSTSPAWSSTSKKPSCARASTSSTPTPPNPAAAAPPSPRNFYSAVVGSITAVTSSTEFAGNPPSRACSRTISAFGAM